jgi:hypothetical protein
MYEVLSQLCFLKPMLTFPMQTFYQPLFSIFSSTLFPSIILFPSKSFPHQKAQSKGFSPIFEGKKVQKPKPKAKSKSPSSSFRGLSEQQAGWSYGEGCDIVTGETWIPASLITIYEMQLFCLSLFHGQGL